MAIVRFGVSIDTTLLKRFDALIGKKGHANRSEAIRDLVRDSLVIDEWETSTSETVGSITIVYSHETRELTDTLTDLQHRYHSSIISSMHIHLDHHNCLEVVIMKGRSKELRHLADQILSLRGVKHGQLVITSTGKELK